MFAEHHRGLGSAESPKPEPRIPTQLRAELRKSTCLLRLPFLILKELALPSFQGLRSKLQREVTFSSLIPTSDRRGVRLAPPSDLFGIRSSLLPTRTLLRSSIAGHFLLFLRPHGLQAAYFQCPSCASRLNQWKTQGLVAHGPAIWPPPHLKGSSPPHPPFASVCGHQGKTCPGAFPRLFSG